MNELNQKYKSVKAVWPNKAASAEEVKFYSKGVKAVNNVKHFIIYKYMYNL